MGTEAACGMAFGVDRLGCSSGRPRLRAGLRPNAAPYNLACSSRWVNIDSSLRMYDEVELLMVVYRDISS